MKESSYSGKKVFALCSSGVVMAAALVLSATSATAYSNKAPKNVIPAITKVCSTVAEKNAHQQDFASSFTQCVETLGLGIAYK